MHELDDTTALALAASRGDRSALSDFIRSTQSDVCSRRVMAATEGLMRIGSGSMNAISRADRQMVGQVLKNPRTLTGGSLRKVRTASSN